MSLGQQPRQLKRTFPSALRVFIGLYALSWLVWVVAAVSTLASPIFTIAIAVLGILIYLGAMIYAKVKGGIGTWLGWVLYTIIPFGAVVLILRWAAKGKTEVH